LRSANALQHTLAEHGQVLFGTQVSPEALVLTTVAKDTRAIFRVRKAGSGSPPLIAKTRSPGRSGDRELMAAETEWEFGVHSAVWHSLQAAGSPLYRVPKPLLLVAEQGLIVMEEASGEPVVRSLWREGFGLTRHVANDDRIRGCGEWLRAFAARVPRLTLPEAPPRIAETLAANRSRHHVYSLIGRSGQELADAVVANAVRRLEAYRVDRFLASRIEKGLTRSFDAFGGGADIQGNVHGKYSIADVVSGAGHTTAIDLEQAGYGSLYLDAAYFLFQIAMVMRWRPLGRRSRPAELRQVFLSARWPEREFDERLLEAFIAYYLVNSLRPGGQLPGFTARLSARAWLERWLSRVGV